MQDETSAIVNTTGYLRLSSYYLCCLLVLPSHIMGMSRFVRAEDLGGSSRSLSQWVHLDTVIVLEKQLVNRM